MNILKNKKVITEREKMDLINLLIKEQPNLNLMKDIKDLGIYENNIWNWHKGMLDKLSFEKIVEIYGNIKREQI